MAKKSNKKNFGWTSKKSWNRTDKTHDEKLESKAYSFKLPKKKRPPKIWCAPGAPQTTIKRKGQEGRPYGYKPIYDADATLNYQSEAGRLEKASGIQPEIRIGKLLFYRASDDCYWHVVIPPDFGHEDLEDIFCEVPPDFFFLAPNEFWARYPRPNTARPGQPLFDECPPEEPDDPDDPDDPWDPEQPPRRPPRLGCTNIAANNFDPQAQVDDGSCRFDPPGEGVDFADSPDGRCRTAGCTDPEASNYNELACYDDGSCQYPQDDPDEPEQPPPDCENPEPSKCKNGPPPGDCRWASGGSLTGDDGAGVCGNGSIAPGFTQDNGYVEFGDGERKTLCCAPSDGSGGSQTDMFWIEGSGNWSRARGDGASPVGGAATRRGPNGNPSIGVSSARGNGLTVCKHPPTHPENSKCGGLGGWRAYDNDGEIASGCGDPRISGGCDQARGDVFCNLPECQPKWKRSPGSCDCIPSYDADGFSSKEECETGLVQGGQCATTYTVRVCSDTIGGSPGNISFGPYCSSVTIGGPISSVGLEYTRSETRGIRTYDYYVWRAVDSNGQSAVIYDVDFPGRQGQNGQVLSEFEYERGRDNVSMGAFYVEIRRNDGLPDNCGCTPGQDIIGGPIS